MVRAPFFDKNGQKKGAWSQEEDDKLRAYVQKYGHWNWRELPKFAGLSRCGKSCRLRWMNYLRPGVKHGNFSKEEEDLIIELHKQFGNKWSKIAAKLPGRTDNEIKNSWHTHLKWRTKKGESSSGFQEKRSSNVKVESSPANNIPFPPIFESFQLPPESSSTTEFSHLTCDSATVSKSSNWIAEVESSLANNIPFPPIFESFQLPPESSSTTEFSHLTCDSAMVNKSSNWIAEVESSLANNIPFPPLFESFQLSPESSSTTEFSHLTCDSAMVSTSSNWIAEDSHALSETFEYCGEDFWTQPFVAERDAHRLPLPLEGLVSSYFTSYYEDDAIDLFYQVTKELPGNFS